GTAGDHLAARATFDRRRRSRPRAVHRMTEAVERLWAAVVDGDQFAASEVVISAYEGGMSAEDVLLDVIGAVQRRVGVEWAANRLSVAQEHAATAINDRVITVLTQLCPRPVQS